MLRPVGPPSRRISMVSALASSSSCSCSSFNHSITSPSTALRSLSSRATLSSRSRQQRLYFLPLPHGQDSLREGTLASVRALPDINRTQAASTAAPRHGTRTVSCDAKRSRHFNGRHAAPGNGDGAQSSKDPRASPANVDAPARSIASSSSPIGRPPPHTAAWECSALVTAPGSSRNAAQRYAPGVTT
jgi:hypothetical protein